MMAVVDAADDVEYHCAAGPWWRQVLWDDYSQSISGIAVDANSDVAAVAEFTRLRDLSLDGTDITDLTPLAEMTLLTRLHLNLTPVTDLTPLAGLTQLEELSLNRTPVTDLTPLLGLQHVTVHVDDASKLTLPRGWVGRLD